MAFRFKVCGLFLFFLISNAPITSTEKMAEEVNVGQLAAASNDLAIRLYKQLAAGYSKNIFFSPLSLSMAFGMLFHGAKGKTVEVLRSALGYEAAGLNTEVSNMFYHLLQQELPPANAKNPAYTLDIANQILIQEGLQLKKAFKGEINNLFLAPVDEGNFKKDGSKIVDDVNHWVDEKTHGKIKTLLDKVDPGTAMLLLNAVYFKGTWETQFKISSTKEQVFYNNGVESNEKKVQFMHVTDKFHYTSTDDTQIIELPYTGNNISMIILLPTKLNGLHDIEESLTCEKIASIRNQLYKQKVILSLPKFKIEYDRDMTDDFKAIGAAEVFNASKANFTGISNNNTYVSQVIHKAAIDVNEEGSVAAAATGIGMMFMARPMAPAPTVVFNANHPFLFAIIDNRNELIMFAGRVNEL